MHWSQANNSVAASARYQLACLGDSNCLGGQPGMGANANPRIGSIAPSDAWDLLQQDDSVVLVDVRTTAEWTFVGVPDLSPLGREAIFVEWAQWPGMSPNTRFVEDLAERMNGRPATAILFLCRSGVRSLAAAEAVDAAFQAQGLDVGCINVSTGFEGDLNAQKHRGGLSGWKVEGLPWRQA